MWPGGEETDLGRRGKADLAETPPVAGEVVGVQRDSMVKVRIMVGV